MPILVKHSGNASPTAYGSFGAGQGKRYVEDSRIALDDINQATAQKRSLAAQRYEGEQSRLLQDKEQSRALASRESELEASRKFQEEQSAKELEWRSQKANEDRAFSVEQSAYDLQSRSYLQDKQADLSQQAAAAEQERQKENIEFGYSSKQRADFNELSDAYDQAAKSGEFTPEELQDVHREIMTKQAGIQPLARLKKKSIWPEGQDVGQTWQSDDGRFLLTRDAKGNVKKMAETNAKPTWKDKIEARKMFMEQFKDSETDAVDFEAVDQAMNEMFAGSNAEPGAVEGQQPVAPVVAPTLTPTEKAEKVVNEAKVTKLNEDIKSWSDEIAKGNLKYGPDMNPFAESYQQKIVKAEEELKKHSVTGELIPVSGFTQPKLPDAKKGTKGQTIKDAQVEAWNIAASLLTKSTNPTEKAILQKRLVELGGTPEGAATKIADDAGYNQLPSGALFVGPDGKTRRKP